MRDGFCALRHGGFSFCVVLAACAAGGRWGPVRGCRPSEAPSALPPDDPAGFVVYPTLPRTGLQGPSISHHSTRAARLLLRELPRCARGSPSAPRNASMRLRVEWDIGEDVLLTTGCLRNGVRLLRASPVLLSLKHQLRKPLRTPRRRPKLNK